MLALTVIKEKLGLEFWGNTYEEYKREADELVASLKEKLLWARGEYPSLKEIDEAEGKLYGWVIGELQSEFDKNLTERLVGYFKKNFYADQNGSNYNFNAMDE